jgi:hypothetical protein
MRTNEKVRQGIAGYDAKHPRESEFEKHRREAHEASEAEERKQRALEVPVR